MTTLFGVNFESPQELQDQANQQFEQFKAQGVPSAAASQAVTAIFGNSRIRRAAATQEALSRATTGIEKQEGESEFDFQVRQAEAIRNATAKINPEVALQANDRILSLRTQQQEQRKLRAQADVEESKASGAVKTAELLKSPVIFKLNADGSRTPHRVLPTGTTPEEATAALQVEQSNTVDRLDLGTGVEAFSLDSLQTSSSGGGVGGLNRSTVNTRLTSLENGTTFAKGLRDVAEDLLEDPLALAPGSNLASGATGFLNFLERAKTEFLQDFDRLTEDEQQSLAAQFDRRADTVINNTFRGGRLSDQLRSQIKGLAYKLAKSLDPGGRLSDQDVEMAIEMLTGASGDPQTIINLFRRRLSDTHEGLQLSLDLADRGLLLGQSGADQAERYRGRMAEAEEKLVQLWEESKRRRQKFQEKATEGGPRSTEEAAVRSSGADVTDADLQELIRQARGS